PMQHDITISKLRLGKTQLAATFGADWATSVSNIPNNLAVLTGAEAINNQAILNSIANDDVLSVVEKNQLTKLHADLEARYTDLVARATSLAISTTAVSNARTAWKNLLASYAPAWNDTTQDTSLAATDVLGGGFPASWTPDAGVTTAASGLYTVVTDGSATIAGRLMRTVANAGSNTYVAGVVIKKDAVAKATRYVRVMLRGSSTTYSIDLDTSTGETVAVSGATGGALDIGDAWYA